LEPSEAIERPRQLEHLQHIPSDLELLNRSTFELPGAVGARHRFYPGAFFSQSKTRF
jgi:hypothetical protein